jgi:hypothetical protein
MLADRYNLLSKLKDCFCQLLNSLHRVQDARQANTEVIQRAKQTVPSLVR